MQLHAISGLGSKGPACFLLEVAGRRLLFDLGAGPDAGVRPDVEDVGPVDAVLLSHGHADHCAALDMLDLLGDPPVYATVAAQATGHRRLREARIVELPLQGATTVCGLPLQTGRSGHAPGGIWMHLGVEGGFLYMGDHFAASLLYACDPPPPARVMLLDASYGDDDTDVDAARVAWLEAVLHKPALLPAPAGGRGPEMAAFATAYGMRPALCPQQLQLVDYLSGDGSAVLRPGAAALLRDCRSTALALSADTPPQALMIAATADAEGGVAGQLCERWQQRADEVAILFSGHVARGTLAESLYDSGRAGFARWHVHPTLTQLRDLVAAMKPQIVLPAFGDARHHRAWQAAFSPALVLLDTPVAL
ncbi:MBL fold metallo-hydrolase [Uliginosibacterium sp. H1]|uniref:MBL fold metallo-hydrolase n=1 Tax=Uliginosibacterium sp. H1 TaxID=3114757 RepID=UPI002E194A32|nr:MBL fold metallo-hydrolase [Uliginosibacterium sp. H1]